MCASEKHVASPHTKFLQPIKAPVVRHRGCTYVCDGSCPADKLEPHMSQCYLDSLLASLGSCRMAAVPSRRAQGCFSVTDTGATLKYLEGYDLFTMLTQHNAQVERRAGGRRGEEGREGG